jgi:hypothetical protein
VLNDSDRTWEREHWIIPQSQSKLAEDGAGVSLNDHSYQALKVEVLCVLRAM